VLVEYVCTRVLVSRFVFGIRGMNEASAALRIAALRLSSAGRGALLYCAHGEAVRLGSRF
jgi:hypothetical protein